MEEVVGLMEECEVGPNNLWKNYQSLRTFLGTKYFSLFPGVEEKKPSYVNT